MSQNSEKVVLFVGHRAGQLMSTLKELGMCTSNTKTLYYQGLDPLSNRDGSVFLNNEEVLCNVEYDKEILKEQLKAFFELGFKEKQFLLIGDPTEWMYQAFTEAVHSNANLFPSFAQPEDFYHAWFYPMGMIASDIRKEISALVYNVKKNGSTVFVTRKTDAALVGFIPKVIDAFEANRLIEFALQTIDLEQIVGKSKENLQLG